LKSLLSYQSIRDVVKEYSVEERKMAKREAQLQLLNGDKELAKLVLRALRNTKARKGSAH
jgi:hypothetical protein